MPSGGHSVTRGGGMIRNDKILESGRNDRDAAQGEKFSTFNGVARALHGRGVEKMIRNDQILSHFEAR